LFSLSSHQAFRDFSVRVVDSLDRDFVWGIQFNKNCREKLVRNLLLRLLLLIIVAAPAAANECKVWQPATYETKSMGVEPKDWTWSCDSINALRGSVFNRTGYSVDKIIITGATSKKSVGENIFVFLPNTSHDYYFRAGNGICGVDDGARMRVEYSVRKQGFCKVEFTNSEMAAKRQKEAELRQKNAEQAKIQAKQDILYNNCVITKSKGIDRSAINSVRKVCREIAKNPSAWQKFRWGP
jgi:hypothetical protein